MKKSATPSKIRILIADDHGILRSGLQMLINAQADMIVVDQAEEIEETIQKVDDILPDVLLLDIGMGQNESIHLIQHIQQNHSHVKVLILTVHEDLAYLRTCLKAGAVGYVVKRAADVQLISGIREVYQGRSFVDLSLDACMTEGITRGLSSKKKTQTTHAAEELSPREQEVISLIAEGYTNAQIADQICLSVKSVESYRARVSMKLNLRSRSELVRYALDSGLLSRD